MRERTAPGKPEPRSSKAVEQTSKPTIPAVWLLLPILAALVLAIIDSQRPDGRLHVWVLDVGQGDAILLRTPEGHTALIDGGPGATPMLNGVGNRLPFWQRDIDMLVLTHPHQDHLMGLPELLGRYNVGQVVQTVFTATSGVGAVWLTTLARKQVPVHYAARGDVITFNGEPDLALHVLNPSTEAGASRPDPNSGSVVLRLVYGQQSMLLAGDAEEPEELDMLRSGMDLGSTVLKVGHHGSDTSTTPGFLRAVSPGVAIISSGAGNKFGHPSPSTLDVLAGAGVMVYRTDLDGTVELIADREQMWVRSER